MHDTVGIDVESHLNLRNSTRGRWDANKIELSEELVVGSHVTLSLQNLDANLSLVVGSRRELLALLRWDGGVAGNKPGEDSSQSLDSE
mmetsp:Transcript_10530/g.16485  ORF Transcript_10530/g.16485 Transcript_10530/m.16485 type:complete len:88 (-) Transcript_10530:215-478(-)